MTPDFRPPDPPLLQRQVAALRIIFGDTYRFNVLRYNYRPPRVEALAIDRGAELYCLISPDAAEIFRVLAESVPVECTSGVTLGPFGRALSAVAI